MDERAKNKSLVSIAVVVVCMRQTIHVFHHKINHTITLLRDMENTQQEYEKPL